MIIIISYKTSSSLVSPCSHYIIVLFDGFVDFIVFKLFVSFGTTSLLDFIIVFVSTSSHLFSLRIRLLMNVMMGHVLIIICVSISNFYVSSLVFFMLLVSELFVLVLQLSYTPRLWWTMLIRVLVIVMLSDIRVLL